MPPRITCAAAPGGPGSDWTLDATYTGGWWGGRRTIFSSDWKDVGTAGGRLVNSLGLAHTPSHLYEEERPVTCPPHQLAVGWLVLLPPSAIFSPPGGRQRLPYLPQRWFLLRILSPSSPAYTYNVLPTYHGRERRHRLYLRGATTLLPAHAPPATTPPRVQRRQTPPRWAPRLCGVTRRFYTPRLARVSTCYAYGCRAFALHAAYHASALTRTLQPSPPATKPNTLARVPASCRNLPPACRLALRCLSRQHLPPHPHHARRTLRTPPLP